MPTVNDPNGQAQSVTEAGGKGRADVSARADAREYYVSRDEGEAYSWRNATYNYTAADTILLVKNTHTTKALVISSITMAGDSATEVLVHIPTAEVTPTGTEVTGLNRNGNSSNVAAATAKGNETNNSSPPAAATIDFSTRIGADAPYHYETHDTLRLAQNQSVGVDFVTVGAAADVTITGYYE